MLPHLLLLRCFFTALFFAPAFGFVLASGSDGKLLASFEEIIRQCDYFVQSIGAN